jgi:hypothetical protein
MMPNSLAPPNAKENKRIKVAENPKSAMLHKDKIAVNKVHTAISGAWKFFNINGKTSNKLADLVK